MDDITSVTVWRGGIDVLAEMKEETGGALESDILEERGLARFELDGKLAERFGDKGVLKDVSGSVATTPDGGVGDASGKRYFSSGVVLADAGQPLDTAPGSELIAAAPDDRFLLAGSPRSPEERDELLVARFTDRNALDRTFGATGVVALPLGQARTLAPLADGSTVVGSLDGIFVRLDRDSIAPTVTAAWLWPSTGRSPRRRPLARTGRSRSWTTTQGGSRSAGSRPAGGSMAASHLGRCAPRATQRSPSGARAASSCFATVRSRRRAGFRAQAGRARAAVHVTPQPRGTPLAHVTRSSTCRERGPRSTYTQPVS